MDRDLARQVARKMHGKRIVAFTGAGISVESGIPDFRSPGGLWERFDPEEYATIEAFKRDPSRVWQMLRELDEVIAAARPNAAHSALAHLEQMGALCGIITQNVDNLHQEAGSRKVVEFHGNGSRLICLSCAAEKSASAARQEGSFPPLCPQCREVLKPDVVLFGEPIPAEAAAEASRLAREAQVLWVIGTSAQVAPASFLPRLAKSAGALVVETNLEATVLTRSVADATLLGKASEVVPLLIEELDRLRC